MPLPYKHILIPKAKELRKNATQQENHLWYDFLRKYPMRFQRQKSIAGFIADFYCFDAKLIIELDGSRHYTEERSQYDEERTKVLENYGLQILRISNSDIDKKFNYVCCLIDSIVKKKCRNN